ncbi:CGNR zinc finger domain-containing protein [Actinoplanes xinjiangensis]|uniref:CGNR zinc finger domain-containing protein n=1 Tax=Actinoplanes xinjiangensis TaxID=512350 RepID=UPI00341B19FD
MKRSVPATAPGPLAAVQRFLNTLHVERGTDALDEPATAYDWMTGTRPPPPDPQDLDRLRLLRRELRARCGDGTPDDDALTRLAATAPLRLAASATPTAVAASASGAATPLAGAAAAPPAGVAPAAGGLRLVAAGHGHPAVLAALLAAAYDAQRDGTWSRLKICHHDACRWVFYDESRSRTATWCAMGVCGNRAKAAAFRRRATGS